MNGAALLLVVLAGVAADPPVSWQPDEFPVSYWAGPPVAANTLDAWRTVADAHFTFAVPGSGYSMEDNRKMLDFCRQVGLKGLVVDRRIRCKIVDEEGWQGKVARLASDYADHPALFGYYLHDEPNYAWFEALGKVHGEFLRLDPAHPAFINLFPTYASVSQLGTPTYSDHLDKYLGIVKPVVLSYDHYCLMNDGRDRVDYFENLELIRAYAARYDVPAWNVILSWSHLGYRDPTDAEMRWQVYTSLAYGMKGILYFIYWTPDPAAPPDRVAIVDSKGKPTKRYPAIRQLNGEMRTLGKLLLGLTSTGVYHTGPIPRGCRRTLGDLPLRLPDDQPLLIGFFKDPHGADYAMIVNRDHGKPQEVRVGLKEHVVGVAEISPQDGSPSTVPITGGLFRLSLEAGGGRLVRLETRFQYPRR
ncbi:hypothetical protein ACFL5Q_05145 [Planctomycetota bacterium]